MHEPVNVEGKKVTVCKGTLVVTSFAAQCTLHYWIHCYSETLVEMWLFGRMDNIFIRYEGKHLVRYNGKGGILVSQTTSCSVFSPKSWQAM